MDRDVQEAKADLWRACSDLAASVGDLFATAVVILVAILWADAPLGVLIVVAVALTCWSGGLIALVLSWSHRIAARGR